MNNETMPGVRDGVRSEAWMRTASGGRFYVLDPRPEDVRLGDIAHALSQTCRFGGHTPRPYSVAEHSLLVGDLVLAMGGDPLYGLLHDAAEAYIGDMVAPLKVHMPDYKAADLRVTDAIAQALRLPVGFDRDPVVKKCDLLALAIEASELMGVDPAAWGFDETWPWRAYAVYMPVPMTAAQARGKFISMYQFWDAS